MFRSRGGGGSQHSVRDHRIRGAVAAIRLGDGKAKDGVRPLWLLDVSGWVLFFFFFFLRPSLIRKNDVFILRRTIVLVSGLQEGDRCGKGCLDLRGVQHRGGGCNLGD